MGACAAHFKRKKYRQNLPSLEHHDSQIQLDLPNHSQKVAFENHQPQVFNPTGIVRVVPTIVKDKDKSASCFGRQPSRSTPEFIIQEKPSISKANKLNEKILHWIDTSDTNGSWHDPPESMLSLDSLLIREHDPPRHITNRQEIEDQKRAIQDTHSNESEHSQIAF